MPAECCQTNFYTVTKNTRSIVDYTYHFNMSRFSILDHFIVSGDLFDSAISSFYSVHSIDNTSDHKRYVVSRLRQRANGLTR